jgi:hypothetical protein
VRPGQQASVRASDWSRARVRSVHRLGEQVGGDVQRRAFNGARRGTVRSCEQEAAAFKACSGGGVRGFAANRSELWLSMGSHSAAMCRNGGPMAYGGGVRRRVGVCRVAPTTGLLASRTGEKRARRMDQRTWAGLSVRVRRRTVAKPTWSGATLRAPRRSRACWAPNLSE